MKRHTFLLVLLILPLLVGCEKTPGSGKGGIYLNGRLEHQLKCAYSFSTVLSPGRRRIFEFYDKMYSECPSYEVKELVLIEEWQLINETYERLGDKITKIQIYASAATGDIVIPMNHGKYEGGNDLVSSVQINNYSYPKWDISGKLLEKAHIDIEIVLNDGQKINIRYIGTMKSGDGYWD